MSSHAKSPLNIVLGVHSVGDKSLDAIARFDTPDEVKGLLNIFAARGYSQLDTSRNYSPHAPGTSEPRLAAVGAGDRFTIDTKVISFGPGSHTKAKVAAEIDTSLDALKIKQINIEYLNVPDRQTPLKEACEAMHEAYKNGKFKKWGLSNYKPEEVQEIVEICEQNDFIKPSVFQGHYNAIAREVEEKLFPILRSNNMAFYAYSVAGGGFFAGNHKKAQTGGRFDSSHATGSLYKSIYMKESIMSALESVLEVSSKHGISGHAGALRWAVYHSILDNAYGDSVIVGASSSEQLTANLDMIEAGPLPDEVAVAFEGLRSKFDEEILYYF